MNKLDPEALFDQIASDIPNALRAHIFVTGSLAAAYHYRAILQGRAINTKDADLVIHPAGHTDSCRDMAERLRASGWRNTEDCYPQESPQPEDSLRAIRLLPPGRNEYFIEFLNIPERDQSQLKRWLPLQLADGWYGLPSFKYMGITAIGRLTSREGLEYAQPSMMALANLLSHPEIGHARIETGAMAGVLRSAKDLGRVIALARLETRDKTESWIELWRHAIEECFPTQHKELLSSLGRGLEELLMDANAMEDARKTTDIGLLSGMDATVEMLGATGRRLLADVIEPLRNR